MSDQLTQRVANCPMNLVKTAHADLENNFVTKKLTVSKVRYQKKAHFLLKRTGLHFSINAPHFDQLSN